MSSDLQLNSKAFSRMRRELDMISPIPDRLWEDMKPKLRYHIIPKDEVIITQGEKPEKLFYILSGGVKHFIYDEKENEKISEFCIEGEFTGDSQNKELSEEWIVSFTKTEVISLNISDLQVLISKHNSLQSLMNLVLMNYYRLRQKRINLLLQSKASEKYTLFLDLYPGLIDKVPLYQIASFLGISAETLSRIRLK